MCTSLYSMDEFLIGQYSGATSTFESSVPVIPGLAKDCPAPSPSSLLLIMSTTNVCACHLALLENRALIKKAEVSERLVVSRH